MKTKNRNIIQITLIFFGLLLILLTYYLYPKIKEKQFVSERPIEEEGNGIDSKDNYFENVYLPWVKGDKQARINIEDRFNGVHEFKPHIRGECRTASYWLSHPESIDEQKINKRIQKELGEFK